jgi:hypothetical protein
VSVSGANLSGRKAVVKLRSGANQDVVPVDIRVEDRAVVFVVPEKTSGRHNVYVSIDGEADTLAGRLDIVGVAPAVRRVTAISPAGQGGVGDLLQRELNASAARGGASRSGPDEEAVFVRSFERAA